MNGSKIDVLKIAIDTNVIFMAIYNPESKAGKIIEYAIGGKIELFSTDSVKEELMRVLKKEMKLNENDAISIISSLPITWISKEIYITFIDKTKVKHKPDKPVEAVSLILNCDILSADKHFKNRININKLLGRLK